MYYRKLNDMFFRIRLSDPALAAAWPTGGDEADWPDPFGAAGGAVSAMREDWRMSAGLPPRDAAAGVVGVVGGVGVGAVFAPRDAEAAHGARAPEARLDAPASDAAQGFARAVAGLKLRGDAGANLLRGKGGADTLLGLAGDDRLFGGGANDRLAGGLGDDRLVGGAGNDRLLGNAGADVLLGKAGADILLGGGGDDTLNGGGGDDRLVGGGGDDRLLGKAGADTMLGKAGADTLLGGGGDDRLVGGGGADLARGGGGADRIIGGGGNDSIIGQAGNDSLTGEAGRDDLRGGFGNDRMAGGGGADTLYGQGGADTMFGDGGADTLYGDAGDDTLYGGAGGDALFGGAGDDTIFAGDGDDAINAGPGADSVNGGAGVDTLLLTGEAGEYAVIKQGAGFRIVHRGGGDGTIDAVNVEKVKYGAAAVSALASNPVGELRDADATDDKLLETAPGGARPGITAAAVDPDGEAVSYSISDARFAIDAAGVVSVVSGGVFDAGTESTVSFIVTAESRDGSISQRQFDVEIVPEAEALKGALDNDTGASATDGLTNDPTLRAEIVGAGAVTALSVAIDGGAAQAFGALDASGVALFTPAGLADGAHSAVITATFASGAMAVDTVDFTLDSAAPDVAKFALAPSSDSGVVGDGATGYGVVSLLGETEQGAVARLGADKALAGAGGRFSFSDVEVATGDNDYDLEVEDAAGNTAQASLTLTGNADGTPSPVIFWTRAALDAIAQDAMIDTHASRLLAMVSVAMHDAVAAIDGGNPFLVAGEAAAGLSMTAAVAAAAHGVLAYAFPSFAADLDAKLADYLSGEDAAAVAAGKTLGGDIADTVIALRDGDGWDDFESYPGSEEVGYWRPTAPLYDIPLTPNYATMDTWATDGPAQFRVGGPPALTSAAYADAVAEVRTLGARDSAARSDDQTEAARFWSDGLGTYTTPGHWADIAMDLAEADGLGIAETARLGAMLSVGIADAMIAAWDAKYEYGLWRPSDAIQNADDDGNPATSPDADWASFLINPAHPEYVSGHSSASGAAAAVLAEVFGDDTAFSTTSLGLDGVTRSFDSFSEAAAENGMSRIWGGVHFGFSNDDGLALGADVAERVLDAFDKGEDTAAPKILFDAPDGDVVAGDSTVAGVTLDGLSGVASLTVSVNGGAAQAVTVAADGGFSHALSGLADGALALVFTATDARGNAASETLNLTRDGAAPTIALTSLSDGGAIAPGARLAGVVDGTGSAIAGFSFSIDGGLDRAITFDADTGAFSKGVDLGDLAAGDHDIALTARDAAGNETVETLTVTLAEALPFQVKTLSPADGAEDVGVTFRPVVEFTRPVDPDTLDNDSFFATDAGGAKLPATVLLSADGKTAWMFFADPMPGAQSVTLHLDGALIAALDGTKLDGDGDQAPGGDYESGFQTVSRAPAPGTSLSGFVVGPGADLKPMTVDDFSVGPDGAAHTDDDEFLVPIAGARVWILGAEDVVVTTDATGFFEFTEVPAGTVKVAIDGRSASNAPEGYFYPEMVLDVDITPGEANTLMDSMGDDAQRDANAGRGEVYLPQISEKILVDILSDQETEVGVPAEGAANLTDEQRGAIKLVVQPGVAVDENGVPVNGASIGISTVPPELVRDMLPPGIMQHTFDLTIQAPGSSTFTTPAELTLPNVFGAAPGTTLNVLSFDHTTGRLVIEGTATVSEDGKTVTTDPGTGITKPGWHGLTPPGGNGCDGGPPLGPDDIDPDAPVTALDPLTMPLYFHDGEGGIRFSREWSAPDALPETPPNPDADADCPEAADDPEGKEQPWTQVTIKIEGPLADFASKAGNLALADQSFVLRAGTQAERGFAFSFKDFEAMFGAGGLKNVEASKLYGSKINIEVREQAADGGQTVTTQDVFVSRFIDASDDAHTDGRWEFAQTVNDGPADSTRDVPLEIIGFEPDVSIDNGKNFFHAKTLGQVWFDPVETGAALTDRLSVDFTAQGGGAAGKIDLAGKGVRPEKYFFKADSFENLLKDVADPAKYPDLNATQRALIDTKAERDAILDKIGEQTQKFFDDAGLKGISETTSSAGANIIDFLDGRAEINRNAAGAITGYGLGGATAAFAASDIDFDKVIDLYVNRADYSKQELSFRAAEVFNNDLGGPIAFYLDNFFLSASQSDSVSDLKFALGHNSAHEIGHNLGLLHTKQGATILVPGGGTDVMAQGLYNTDTQDFIKTLDAARLGLHADWSPAQAVQALSYYNTINTSSAGYVTGINNGVGLTLPDTPNDPFSPVEGPALEVLFADGQAVFDSVDLGTVLADGAGGESGVVTLTFLNFGSEILLIDDFASSNAAFAVSAPAGEIALDPGESVEITVSFDPATAGGAFGSLNFTANDDRAETEIALGGLGKASGAWLTLSFDDGNNLGGLELSDADLPRKTATIRNDGDAALVIDAIAFSGDAGFGLPDLPGDLATSPISLAFGETFAFDFTFDALNAGISRGLLDISSNDMSGALSDPAVIGTGFEGLEYFDWGDDYVAVEINGEYLRTVSSGSGDFEFFLPAETAYHVSVFDPDSGLIAHGYGETPASGLGTDLTSGLVFKASVADDSDFDGLADDIEKTIGSSALRADSNDDGVSDFDAIKLGLNPLDGVSDATGVIDTLDLGGAVRDVLILQDAPGFDDAVALALTATGLSVVDLSDPRDPVLASQIALGPAPVGAAHDALFGRLALTFADGSAAFFGLADLLQNGADAVATPMTDAGASTAIVALNGVAYFGKSGAVAAHDLNTGEILASTELTGVGAVRGLTREGDHLYALTDDGRLHTLEIGFGGALSERGSINAAVTGAERDLFAAEGVVYIPAGNGFLGGFVSVDVSDPTAPAGLSGVDDGALGGTSIALNGSGLALTVGAVGGVGAANAVDLVDVSDPADTGALVTRFTLDAAPLAATIARGLAYVGDAAGNLHVINYLSRDVDGVAPVVTVTTPPADEDAAADGVQILEGARIAFRAAIADDVQVGFVELLIDGAVALRDLDYPFEYAVPAPLLKDLPAGVDAITVQLRATDTGGNAGLSEAMVLQIIPDTIAPTLVESSIDDSGAVGRSTRSFRFDFSEPIQDGPDGESPIALIAPGGGAIAPDDVVFNPATGEIVLAMPELTPGDYRFEIDQSKILDLAGNPMGDAVQTIDFTVDLFSLVWIGADDGSWSDAANWSAGRMPFATDDLLIDVAGAPTVTLTAFIGDVAVATLVSREELVVSRGARLTIAGDSDIDRLVIDGGTVVFDGAASIGELVILNGGVLDGDGDVSVTGDFSWVNGSVFGDGALVVEAGATADIGPPEDPQTGFRSYDAFLSMARAMTIEGEADMHRSHVTLGRQRYDTDLAQFVQEDGDLEIAAGGVLNLRSAFSDFASSKNWFHGFSFSYESGRPDVRSSIVNNGVINKLGGGLSDLDGVISGAGAYNAVDGGFALRGQLAASEAGGFDGLTLANGLLTMDADLALDRLDMVGGMVFGDGDLTIADRLEMREGAAMGGAGTTTLAEGATALLGSDFDPYGGLSYRTSDVVYLQRDLNVAGDLHIEQARVELGARVYDASVQDFAVRDGKLHVAATGTVNIEGANTAIRRRDSVALGAFVNDGAVTKTGGGVTEISATASGSGGISVVDGVIELTGDEIFDLTDMSGVSELRVNGGRLVVQSAISLDKLDLANGQLILRGDGALTVGDMQWTGGDIRGDGQLIVPLGGTIDIGLTPPPERGDFWSTAVLRLDATLEIAGAAQMRNARVGLGGNGFDPLEAANAVYPGAIEVKPTGVLTLLGHNVRIDEDAAQANSFVNDGVIRVKDGVAELGADISGDGAIEYENGELNLIAGEFTLTAALDLSRITVSGGTLIVAEAASLDGLTVTGGSVALQADLTVDGEFAWLGGRIAGVGALSVAAAATAELGLPFDAETNAGAASLYLGAELEVLGALDHGVANLKLGLTESAVQLPGHVTVGVDGVYRFNAYNADITRGSNIAGNGFVNHGAVIKTAQGVSTISDLVAYSSDGTVTAVDGLLETPGGDVGAYAPPADIPRPVDPGRSDDVLADGELRGGETLTLTNGESLTGLTINGGTLIVEGGVDIADLTLLSGEITGGDVTVTGDFRWNGGTLSGAGTLAVADTATALFGAQWDENGSDPAVALNLARDIVLEGDATLERATIQAGRRVFDADLGEFVDEEGWVIVDAGVTFTLSGRNADFRHIAQVVASGIVNNGTVIKDAGGVGQLSVDYMGDGAVSIIDGVIEIGLGGEFHLTADTGIDAIVVDGGTLVVEDAVSIDRLTIRSGELTGGGDLSVQQRFDWAGGALEGGGRLIVADGAMMEAGSGRGPDEFSSATRLYLNRTLDLFGDGDIEQGLLDIGDQVWNPATSQYDINAGALNVKAGALLRLIGPDADMQGWGVAEDTLGAAGHGLAGIADLVNDGTVLKTGGGTSNLAGAITGDGAFEVETGRFAIGSGAHLTLDGGLDFAALAVTGGGYVTVSTATAFDSLTVEGGSIRADADVTVTGSLDFDSGNIFGDGALTLDAGATGLIGEVAEQDQSFFVSQQARLGLATTVNGALAVEQGALWLGSNIYNYSTQTTETQSSRLTVAAGGSIDMRGALTAIFQLPGDGDSGLTNDGLISKTGEGYGDLGATITGDGAFVSNDGRFRLVSGGDIELGAGLDVDGLTVVGGGVATLAGAAALDRLDLQGGEISGDGDLVIADEFRWTGGRMLGEGRTTVAATATAQIGPESTRDDSGFQQSLVELGRELEFAGDGAIEQAQVALGVRAFDPVAGLLVDMPGSLIVDAGATLEFFGPVSDITQGLFGNTDSSLINNGTLLKTGGGTSVVEDSIAFTDNGTVTVVSGEFDFGGTFIGEDPPLL